MDGWKWNLDISIIFLSKSRVISRRNQNLPPLHTHPSWHYTTHPLVTLVPHLCVLFWGRSFLQPKAAYCVDRPSFLSKKRAGHRWQEGMCHQIQWEVNGSSRSTEVSEDGPPCFSSWWARRPPPRGMLNWIYRVFPLPICDAAFRS